LPSYGVKTCNHLPINRLSPPVSVTNEHIMSDNISTSLSFFGDPSSLWWFGVQGVPLPTVPPGESLPAGYGLLASPPVLSLALLSASLFSSSPKSVLPSSNSGTTPDNFKTFSIRSNRFSRLSIYFALNN